MGVSSPFQLLRVGACREMCVVEEDGMVVVRSNESVLHDKINEVRCVCVCLGEDCVYVCFGRKKEGCVCERERKRESVYVCVCVCVGIY